LGWARSALDQAQPLHLRRAAENLPIGIPQQQQQEEAETPVSAKQTLMRDFLMAMAVIVPVILAYPWFANYLPEGVRTNLATVTGGVLSTGNERPAATVPAAAPAPAPAAIERPTISVSRSVNVRATPATKAAVLLTLPKGGSLIVLEQSGNWTHVEIPAKVAGAKAQQGWVFTANLAAKKESSVSLKNDASTALVSKNPAPPAANPAPADPSQAAAANAAPAAPAVSQTPPENTPAPAAPSQ